jgi:hypothetical protein
MASQSDQRPPWKRKRPNQKRKKLTAAQRGEARARARAAGRKYPNLVDNMAVARKRKPAKSAKTTKPAKATKSTKATKAVKKSVKKK